GRTKEATAQFQKTLDLERNFTLGHYLFGLALVHDGKNEEAVKEFEQAVQSSLESSIYQSMLAFVYAQNGRIEEARKILGDVIGEAQGDRASWQDVAGIYAALGEKDHALVALEMAFQRRDSRMTMLINHCMARAASVFSASRSLTAWRSASWFRRSATSPADISIPR